jgi:hypothetical protein
MPPDVKRKQSVNANGEGTLASTYQYEMRDGSTVGALQGVSSSPLSCSAKAEHPVRHSLSVRSRTPVEYWIVRLRGR